MIGPVQYLLEPLFERFCLFQAIAFSNGLRPTTKDGNATHIPLWDFL